MHMGSIDTLKLTGTATTAIAERRFVTFANGQAVLNSVVKGVSAMAAEIGDALPITLIGAVDMEAGAAIAEGDELVSDANGRPIPKGANTNVAARALNAAPIGGRVSVLLR
ncbi:hypothetical protein J2X65_002030 [Ancylobacter sp. 3268]|uniref:DUF2190 family protein n=1 Tax=Ancylobacter sp. 3268 TaxID=2817752 RepID=UPI00285BA0AE|nr:DUF2190 family protein [Ancylobacter sp. 3268]MDR6952671.1 hypothetical protein [Ancylobacter sp. 3268]